jgi:hypothetical protein
MDSTGKDTQIEILRQEKSKLLVDLKTAQLRVSQLQEEFGEFKEKVLLDQVRVPPWLASAGRAGRCHRACAGERGPFRGIDEDHGGVSCYPAAGRARC